MLPFAHQLQSVMLPLPVGHGLCAEGGANFYPYTLQHSLLDRVSQNKIVFSYIYVVDKIEIQSNLKFAQSKLKFSPI
jgi:hypothetical protein